MYNNFHSIITFQVNDLEQKIQFIEKFASETAEKYQELATHQISRQQIDELKEKNKNLKNVRAQGLIYFDRFHAHHDILFSVSTENNAFTGC